MPIPNQTAAALNQEFNSVINALYKGNYTKVKPKEDPSSSQTIYTLQIPEALLESSLASIDRELGERASALSEIARLLEVVEETDSLILHHISNLRTAASQSERKKVKKTPVYQYQLEPAPIEDFEPQPVAGQSAGAGGWSIGPGPSLAGQG